MRANLRCMKENINEVRMAKSLMEKAMIEQIHLFEEATGCEVTGVRLVRSERFDMMSDLISLETAVPL